MTTVLAAAPADVLAWEGDRLLVTSAAVNAAARRPRLSPSTAKSVRSCAARYAGEWVLKSGIEAEDPFAPAPVGTAAHTVMERLMKLARTKRTPLAARTIMYRLMTELTPPNPTEHWPGLPADRHPEWLALVDAAFMGLFGILDPRTVVVHKTELRLDDVFIGSVPFKGFVDLISQVDDDAGRWLEIVDYKTGSRIPWVPPGQINDHHDQIRLYRIGLAQKLGTDKQFRGALYYTRDKIAKSVQVPMRKPDLDATIRRFESAWRRLNRYADAATWPTKVTPLCGWCPLVGTCPAAAREGKVPRVEGLPTAVDLPIPVRRREPRWPAALPDPGDDNFFPGRGEADCAAHEHSDIERHDIERHDIGPPDRDRRDPVIDHDDLDRVVDEHLEQIMATVLYEDKPYLECAENRTSLNPNSYAAGAVFGIVSMAVDVIAKASLPVTGRRVKGLARLFAGIVADVQKDYTGSTGWQQGMNTRLRGALHTTVESMPVPLTGTESDLRDWHEAARRRVAAITRVSVELWDEGEPEFDGDYTALVG